MSLIHEKMYQSTDLAHINITEYFNLLAGNLISSYSIDKHISLDLQVTVDKLSIDTLIPLGLIMNELITNSIKHAFEGKKAGKISVFLGTTEDRRYKLIISDNGNGMKTGVPVGKSATMGMELIKVLIEKIDGAIERRPQKGTSFVILFQGLEKDRLI
jgi:two-component sensor histidine kinase